IDSEKPELQVSEVAQDDPATTNFKFNLIASDKASGLAKIETSLDEGDFIIWQDNGSHIYVTATATTGKHILNVKATDNAGNTITQSTEFTIADLIAPYITEYPKNTIQGKTEYPNEVITVWLQKDLNVKSNSKGNFYLLTENKLAEGRYALWANVKKTDGTESPSSEKVYFEIKYPQQNTLDNILNTIKNNWFINIPLLGIGLLIILGLLFIRSRHKPQVKIVETKNTPSKIDSEDVDNIFKYLRSEVAQAFKILDKSKTKLEHKKNQAIALKKIQKDLTSAEKFIIEKCIKKK
ncbi:MAG: hypothetical protein NT091_05410, partial [Candidatus Falkowbacteria bacterium]|nr:hypothetical protein [Candidatus Falkowbacteria bacterium]